VSQVTEPTDADAIDAIPVGPGTGRTIGLVIAWIGVAIVAVCAIWFVWSQVFASSGGSLVERYAQGKISQLYESVPDGFKVELPTTPRRTEHASANGPTIVVVSTPGSGYQFSVTREPQTETALESFTATLNTAAGSLADQVGGEIVSQTDPVPFGAVAVKDVVFRKGNEYYRTSLFLTQDRLFAVQAKVKGPDKAPFARLSKSFSILGLH
jgi:hypothetical protein